MSIVRANLPAGFELWSAEHLPQEYSGTVLRVPDFTNKLWQIDGLITTGQEPFLPIAIIDPKYIQRTKWCFDKGGWLCTAHSRLRETFATLRGSTALLAGRWSPASIKVIEQHRIGVIRLEYRHIQEVMARHKVDMSWQDKDSDWAAIPAYEAFQKLPDTERSEIPAELLEPIEDPLKKAVLEHLRAGKRALTHVDLELTTNLGEYLRLEAQTPRKAVEMLENTTIDELMRKHTRFFDVGSKTARSLEQQG
jgi:hypothetical protein